MEGDKARARLDDRMHRSKARAIVHRRRVAQSMA
jgi:hypothetical protein